jgi:HD-like signal output (HDOD) protein
VESGTAALEFMEKVSVDIVVSDMHMPVMTGAELLNRIAEQFPHTIRIVLSGQADERMILETVSCTHQFLAKPCEPEVIKATIERACIIQSRIADERVNRIASRFSSLPSFPSNYDELVGKIRDPEGSIEDVARIVSRDPAMSAGILKLVNSAYFGVGRRVIDMIEAVNFIGLDTLRSLVLSVHMFRQFENNLPEGLSLDKLRDHSIRVAIGARAIAKREGRSDTFCGEVFVAGMLHDLGSLALAENFPALYIHCLKKAKADRMELWKVQREEIGFDHAEAGAVLLAMNGLPDDLVDSTAWHHRPLESNVAGFSILTCVHLSDAWSDEDGGNSSGDSEVDAVYIRQNGFEKRLAGWKEAFNES